MGKMCESVCESVLSSRQPAGQPASLLVFGGQKCPYQRAARWERSIIIVYARDTPSVLTAGSAMDLTPSQAR